MDRPNRRKLLRIGVILIVVSVVLFGVSVLLIEGNVSTANNVSISPGSSYTLSAGHVQSGDDVDYKVLSNLADFNATVYVSYGNGDTAGQINITNSPSGSDVFVSQESGNISLVIHNPGSKAISIDASMGSIGYQAILTTVFGFVLILSGGSLIGVYFYSRYMEKRKEKFREQFDFKN